MNFPNDILQRMNPSTEPLSQLWQDNMTQEEIHNIAMSDYGHKAEEVFTEIADIIATQSVSKIISIYTHECLILHRWRDATKKSEYLAIAFCCFHLITLNDECVYDHHTDEDTIGILLHSIHQLGEEFYQPTLQFIA